MHCQELDGTGWQGYQLWALGYCRPLLLRQLSPTLICWNSRFPCLLFHSGSKVPGERFWKVDSWDHPPLPRDSLPSGGHTARSQGGQSNCWQACKQESGSHQFWRGFRDRKASWGFKVSGVLLPHHGRGEECHWPGNRRSPEAWRNKWKEDEKMHNQLTLLQVNNLPSPKWSVQANVRNGKPLVRFPIEFL